MYKKKFYDEWKASMNALHINNDYRAYTQTQAVFSTRYKRKQSENQVYIWIKPRLENIIYHSGIDRDGLRIYKGWKHDLAKYLVSNDYIDYINERIDKNGI